MRSRRRRALRLGLRLAAAVLILLTVVTGVGLYQGRDAIGRDPSGPRLTRMEASPQWRDGRFVNRLPQHDEVWVGVVEWIRGSDHVTPTPGTLPDFAADPSAFGTSPASDLRVTWLGHSTALIEIEGTVILTDPVWGPRASPLTWLGPARWYDPPVDLEALPGVDIVLISHDHYDHLDYPTIERMRDWQTVFIAPLGVGAHLAHWGIPENRIVELDWWESHQVNGLTVTATPARHASGRHFFDRDRTLWAGFAVTGTERRLFFSGDTGMFDQIHEIGERLGPFDITMIEVGAYAQAWADWHMGPEQALEAHQVLGGHVFMPIHWGLFNLSTHSWVEPIERVLVAADSLGVATASLRPGGSWEWGGEVPDERWWPDLPWRSAEEYPVVSSALQ